MGPDLLHVLRGLGEGFAVVIGSFAVGAGIGIGLGELTHDEAADGGVPVAAAPAASSATTGATSASSSTGAAAAEPQAPHIRVLSSTFLSSTTFSGQQRRRARVTVRLRVTARDDEVALGTARLISGSTRLRPDPTARKAADDLFDPIPAGESATGDLRFETAGPLTDRLADRRRATLRIGDRSLPLRLTTAGSAATLPAEAG